MILDNAARSLSSHVTQWNTNTGFLAIEPWDPDGDPPLKKFLRHLKGKTPCDADMRQMLITMVRKAMADIGLLGEMARSSTACKDVLRLLGGPECTATVMAALVELYL